MADFVYTSSIYDKDIIDDYFTAQVNIEWDNSKELIDVKFTFYIDNYSEDTFNNDEDYFYLVHKVLTLNSLKIDITKSDGSIVTLNAADYTQDSNNGIFKATIKNIPSGSIMSSFVVSFDVNVIKREPNIDEDHTEDKTYIISYIKAQFGNITKNVYLGDTKVKKIYLGSTEVKHLYLGTAKIF